MEPILIVSLVAVSVVAVIATANRLRYQIVKEHAPKDPKHWRFKIRPRGEEEWMILGVEHYRFRKHLIWFPYRSHQGLYWDGRFRLFFVAMAIRWWGIYRCMRVSLEETNGVVPSFS